jgi:mono/diheme cytochrome c family protein
MASPAKWIRNVFEAISVSTNHTPLAFNRTKLMNRSIKVFLSASITATVAAGTANVSPAKSSDGAREWRAPSTASQRRNPQPPDPRSTATGSAIYQRECVSCHGKGGKGDGKDGIDLEPHPADLSSSAITGQSDGSLFWKVSTGRRPMPGFRSDLTEDERWHVINFIRTLTPRK